MTRRGALTSVAGGALSTLIGEPALTFSREPTPVERFRQGRRHATTRFGRIAYWERGTGPAALFLHGWPLNGFHWRDAMAGLAGLRRCIAPDFMGLGHTEVPDETDLSPSNQCAMVISFMDAMGIVSADFVTNDSGTTVGQILMAGYPDRVTSVLITNGDVHTNSPPELLKPAISAARAGRLVETFDRNLAEPAFARSKGGLGGLAYTNASFFDPELAEVYLRPLLGSPGRRRQCQEYGVAFEPNPLPALESALRKSRIPTRLLWGTGDALFPTSWAKWLDDALPESRGVRLVDGANLFFTEEFPQLVVEESSRLWSV